MTNVTEQRVALRLIYDNGTKERVLLEMIFLGIQFIDPTWWLLKKIVQGLDKDNTRPLRKAMLIYEGHHIVALGKNFFETNEKKKMLEKIRVKAANLSAQLFDTTPFEIG